MSIRFGVLFGVFLFVTACADQVRNHSPYYFKVVDGKLVTAFSDDGEVIGDYRMQFTSLPIIDEKSADFDKTKYRSDLRDCIVLSNRIKDRTLESALGAAIVGAATGAAVGASMGIPKRGAMVGAAGAGVPGLAYGYISTMTKRDVVLIKCLEGRGYKVLGLE